MSQPVCYDDNDGVERTTTILPYKFQNPLGKLSLSFGVSTMGCLRKMYDHQATTVPLFVDCSKSTLNEVH